MRLDSRQDRTACLCQSILSPKSFLIHRHGHDVRTLCVLRPISPKPKLPALPVHTERWMAGFDHRASLLPTERRAKALSGTLAVFGLHFTKSGLVFLFTVAALPEKAAAMPSSA